MNLQHLTLTTNFTKQISLPYLLALPPEYNAQRTWPLLLFLHGSGERGHDLELVKQHGLPKVIAEGTQLPFIVVSPQCPENTIWSIHMDAILALLDHISTAYSVDKTRIYGTGMSMGGTGIWHMAVTYPELFAAIAPVCGNSVWYVGEPEQVCAIRHIPVWAFHGKQDAVISSDVSERLIDVLQRCGGNAQLTLYPDVDHNCWNQAYATPELYTWLLLHQRS